MVVLNGQLRPACSSGGCPYVCFFYSTRTPGAGLSAPEV